MESDEASSRCEAHAELCEVRGLDYTRSLLADAHLRDTDRKCHGRATQATFQSWDDDMQNPHLWTLIATNEILLYRVQYHESTSYCTQKVRYMNITPNAWASLGFDPAVMTCGELHD